MKLDPSWTRGDYGNPRSGCSEFYRGGLPVFFVGQRCLFVMQDEGSRPSHPINVTRSPMDGAVDPIRNGAGT